MKTYLTIPAILFLSSPLNIAWSDQKSPIPNYVPEWLVCNSKTNAPTHMRKIYVSYHYGQAWGYLVTQITTYVGPKMTLNTEFVEKSNPYHEENTQYILGGFSDGGGLGGVIRNYNYLPHTQEMTASHINLSSSGFSLSDREPDVYHYTCSETEIPTSVKNAQEKIFNDGDIDKYIKDYWERSF
ncbi:hypothetical protein [Streptomyces rhizosphaericus]|uniref:Uncharacterized protein n=1 Tax=Streptomyces rhizosphaericus TaxID=114699 RepID=A0ABN1SVJ5_9ACTN